MGIHFMQSFFYKTLTAIIIVSLAITVLPVKPAGAAPAFPSGFVSEAVVTNLTGPTTIAFAPDGRMFIGQKDGRVRVFENGVLLPTDFINISSQVNNNWDRGLLGIAIHPDFPNTPYVYLLYTYDPSGTTDNGGGARVSRLIRVTADPNNTNVALSGSSVVLLGTNSTLANIGDPNGNDGPASCQSGATYVQDCIAADSPSHTIGTLAFGTDGSLFVSSGDGAHFNYTDARALRALDINSLNGKVLRINPLTGQGYSDNPFYNGNLNSNRAKVYALGLRNPFRITINDLTNEPFIGDVGWNSWEEIDTGRGLNFGWPCYEGNNVTSAQQGSYAANGATSATCSALYAQGLGAVKAPTYAYNHSGGGASVQAGGFYRGDVYPAQYQDALFVSDYNSDWIRYLTFDVNGNATVNNFGTDVAPVGGIVQLLTGPDTNLYYVAYNGPTPNTSEVRRIRYTSGGNTPPTANASASPTSGYIPLTVDFSSLGSFDPDSQPLTYFWDFDDGDTSTDPNPTHTYLASGNFTASLTVTDSMGESGTDTVSISIGNLAPVADITTPTNGFAYDTSDTINYSGTGEDNEDGNLSGASLQWDILLHHNEHVHFDFIPGLTGSSGSFVIPDHGDNTWVELCLTVTDSGGLNDQECVDLDPNTVTLSFNTVPSGLQLQYDGVSYTTPFNVTTNVNSERDLIAPLTQQSCHNFTSWSDGGAASHQITVGANPQTFTATYTPCPITVTVNAGQSKAYGSADPTFTYTSSVPSATFTGSLSRAPGENIGTYAINQGTLAVVGNKYSITSFIPANFTINPPNPPGAFNKSNPADGAVNQPVNPTLSWGTSTGAASYEYCYDTTNDNACSNWTSNGLSTSKALSGLALGTTYYWHVRAINLGGPTYSNGSGTAFRSFTTIPNPPGAFNKISPASGATNQSTSTTLSWGTSTGPASYEYCYDTTNDNACSNWTNNGVSTSRALSGLALGTTYYWHVRASNISGTTNSDGSSTAFRSFTTTLTPGQVTLLSPAADIGSNYSPSFTWNTTAGSTWYYLYVSGSSGEVFDKWYEASTICSAGTCTVAAPVTLNGGNYTWWVRSWNSAGNGLWSNAMDFNTTVPTPPIAATPTSPTGNIGTNYSPSYTWNKASDSTWYRLYINGPAGNVLDEWYDASTICNSTTCTVSLPVTLGGGNHTWWVRTWNSAGDGPWSAEMTFTTASLGAATLVSPTGDIGTNHSPTYTWNEVAGATWYYLWVSGPNGNVIKQWHEGSAVCNSGTCSVTPAGALPAGAYSFWVQTWNPAGTGPWSDGLDFTITPPGAAIPISPNGSGGTNPPVYTWNKVSAATWYYLWVSGSSGNIYKQWYDASVICGASTCSVTAPTSLGDGAYTYWVQTWSPAGYGPWSSGMDFSLP